MNKKELGKKVKTRILRTAKSLVILLAIVGIVNLQTAEAVITGAIYPTSTAIAGTVTNSTNVSNDDGQNAGVSTNNSTLTASGFSMGTQASSINSITFYWDISSYTGSASDDTVFLEYSLDNGSSWRLGSSYTTAQINSWTFPRLVSFTDSTNIPGSWNQSGIANVRLRIRTVKSGQADGTVNADVVYITVNYNSADSTPPNWPSTNSLSATGVGVKQVNLSWINDATDNIGVTGWEIYRKLTSEGVWPGTPIIYIASGTANSYTDTTVSPGTSYEYKIRARDGAGFTSSWSNVAAASTPADNTGPTWPASDSLGTTVISGYQVDLNWTNNATDDVGVTGWQIQRKLNSESTWPLTFLGTAAGAASTYSDLTADDNTIYNYRIRAVDGTGNTSIWSNNADAVTPDMTPPTVTGEMPVRDSLSVLRGSFVKITFSKAMNTSTFTVGTTFTIRDNTNNANITAGQLTFENGNRTAAFDPADPLPANANFTVTVTTGVTDTLGNSLASNYQWSFTTGTDVYLSPHGNFTSNDKACGICHIAHTGPGSELIRSASVDQICYLCHDAGGIGSIYTVQDDFNTAAKTTTHKVPVSQQCTDCHNPHLTSVARPRLLQTASGANSDEQFCWTCHGTGSVLPTDVGTDPGGNARNHQSYYPQGGTGHDAASLVPNTADQAKCSKCHQHHGSNFAKLLTDPQGDNPPTFTGNNKSFCYECHTNAITGPDSGWDGKNVNDNYRGHGNNCNGCHDPHGASNDKYNIFSYSMTPVGITRNNTSFPYNSNNYNACWNSGCHQGANTLLTQTTKNAGANPTGFWQEDLFRNNPNDVRVNLHNFHLKLDQYRPGRGNAVCKECHRPHGVLTTENPDMAHKVGFPSSTVTANTLTSPRFDNLDSAAGDATNGASCNLKCHNYTHTNVSYINGGDIAPGPPPGGQDCMDSCHNDNLVRDMGSSSTLYRHLVESPQPTYNEATTTPAGLTTCLSMCHTDHDIFNSGMNTASSPQLRSTGGSTATPPTSGIPASQVNTTCLASACHGAAGAIDDPDYISPNGYTATSAIGTQVNATVSGFHPINIPTTSGPSNPYAKATLVAPWNTVTKLKCTDCHTSEAAPFGTHASSNRYMLKRLGPQSVSPAGYQLYDALCVMCHSQTTYGYGRTVGTGAGSKAPGTHKYGQHYTGEFGCMECHGGNPEFGILAGKPYNAAAQRGSIHGWASYTYPGRTNPAKGFQNGLTISDYDPVLNTCTALTGNSACRMGAKAIN